MSAAGGSATRADRRGRDGRADPDARPDGAYAAALLGLPGLWPARLAALLGIGRSGPGGGRAGDRAAVGRDAVRSATAAARSARAAWDLVRSGDAAEVPALRRLLGDADPEVVAAHWAAAAARVDLDVLWAAYRRHGVTVDVLGGPGYPPRLADEPSAPYVLFRQGSVVDLDGRTVALVGTRRCTPVGREIATEFGATLASVGVRVVSGLALGIDGAAHEGALAAGAGAPIGVIAGGIDRPYPVRHRSLWQRVAGRGALVGEWPLGTRSEGWRFPARNRLIVALSEAVVVVESREAGGSLVTAEIALERGVPVLAVPGSIRSPLSAGTNRLIRDGAIPACDVDDVLTALSLRSSPSPGADRRPPPSGDAAIILAAMGWDPVSTDTIAARTGLPPAALSVHLAHLELDGWVSPGVGWWQRRGPAA